MLEVILADDRLLQKTSFIQSESRYGVSFIRSVVAIIGCKFLKYLHISLLHSTALPILHK